MSQHTVDEIRDAVRQNYQDVAHSGSGTCCSSSSCCSGGASTSVEQLSGALGYSAAAMSAAPEGANLGLGCGNPLAIASLSPGETVLDIGSGAGFDAFLAARAVGDRGRVIGVDMTAGMVRQAGQFAEQSGLRNVTFYLAEMEHLPIVDELVDVIISNCVINLSPEKLRVFREAHRALKPGGRLAISDIVATAEIPVEIQDDLALHAQCIAGAAPVGQVEAMLAQAGFERISVRPKDESERFIRDWAPGIHPEQFIRSAIIEAVKPE